MKFAYNFLFAVLCIISMASMFAVASEEAEAVTEAVTEDDEAPLRRLVRGRSSVLVDTDEVNERELGRVKPRYDDGIYSSKGSKGGGNGGSTGSKGSKGGSSSVDVGPGSNVCGAGCGEKDFAYLSLKGRSIMGLPSTLTMEILIRTRTKSQLVSPEVVLSWTSSAVSPVTLKSTSHTVRHASRT